MISFRGICFERVIDFVLAGFRTKWPAVSAALRLQVPAPTVEQEDEAGRQFHFIGEVLPGCAAVGIVPGDAPDNAAGAGGGDEFVAEDAFVDRGGGDVVTGVARIVQRSGPLPSRARRSLSNLDFPTS
jgi:hypothetical protein